MATAVIVEWGLNAKGPWTQAFAGPPTVTRIPIVGVEPGQTYFIAVQYQVDNRFSERFIYGPYLAPDFIAGDVSPTGPNIQQMLLDTEAAATQAIEDANVAINAALTTVQNRVEGVWDVVGEHDGEGLRRTIIDIVENGTGSDGPGLTELTTRVTGIEQVVNATGQQALARQTDLTELETAIDASYAKVSQVSDLTTRITSAEGTNTAQNSRLNSVETSLDGKASAAALSNLTTRVTSTEGVNTAQNSRLDSVETNVAGKASAQSVTNLASTVTSNNNTLIAKIGTVSGTVADALNGKASSASVTTLSSTVGTHTSQISTLQSTDATLDGKINAKFGVVLNAGGNITGYQISATQTKSTFDVMAQNFRITDGTSTAIPFEVVGGVVRIKQAQMGTVSAGNITVGTMTQAMTVGTGGRIVIDGANNRILISD